MKGFMGVHVVIPCFKVREKIAQVLSRMPSMVEQIIIVDDFCPQKTGLFVKETFNDPRITVLFNERNLGVGGAVKTGYRYSSSFSDKIVVKLDGDGQMDPMLIQQFIDPLLRGEADYTKGNRFFFLEDTKGMPLIRVIGNAVLSLMTKLSSGYYHIFDPTNGYTAITSRTLKKFNLDKVSDRFFFESDILFRLNLLGARVKDIPMEAVYQDEVSNLRISNVIPRFIWGHLKNFSKRIFYQYYLRDFNVASVELVLGFSLIVFGIVFGSYKWWSSQDSMAFASAGTVMFAALPILLGSQLILSFLNFDIQRAV